MRQEEMMNDGIPLTFHSMNTKYSILKHKLYSPGIGKNADVFL